MNLEKKDAQIEFRLPAKLKRRFRAACATNGMHMSGVLLILVWDKTRQLEEAAVRNINQG